jgi:diguanylate cyclase (GGDEF)-like protein
MTLDTDSPIRLLVVEDDPVVLQSITATLAGLYRISIAKDCKKALQLVRQYRFALILMDINLPDGNGFDLCRQVKSISEFTESIAIVFITSDESSETEVKGLEYGAVDFMHKPLHPELLKTRLAMHVRFQRRTALLDQLVYLDSLTEIGNRRAFNKRLEQEWHRAMRAKTNLALVLLDIDHFKVYNDTYGHPAGDECLRALAKSLVTTFQRSSDACFRYGGEEFAVLLYDCNTEQARQLMDKALADFRALAITHENSPTAPIATFSAGVSSIVPITENTDEFVAFTDLQLYAAKEAGRNQIYAQDAFFEAKAN